MKKSVWLIISAVLLLTTAFGCNSSSIQFDGNSVANLDGFVLEFSTLNTTKVQTLDLEIGNTIVVTIAKESGRLDILVTDPTGVSIYQGADAETAEFKLPITTSGKYTFSITGTKAKGRVSFMVEE